MRRRLAATDDPREVIGDPATPYAGASLQERTLLPSPRAQLATTRFEDWITQSVVK